MADCSLNIIQPFTRCLLLCQLLVLLAASQHQYLFFEETYQPENNIIKLKNMVLDPSTSTLYVGSVNQLYKLSGDLAIEAVIDTGPRQDNPKCIAPPIPCSFERTTTDNINKLLVIDQDRLIVCGSIYQGSCVVRRLADLGLLFNYSYTEVVANTADGSSVGFIAPGPLNENVLYIATSHADWIDGGIPTMSSRVIPPENVEIETLFEILEDAQNFQKSAITIPADVIADRDPFNIYYIYGFSNTIFSYFVAVQPEDHTLMKSPYRTKIAQICQQDLEYYSYIELPLTCKKNGKDYNVAQSATVATIGYRVAATNGFQVGERVLIVTFSESVESHLEPVEASAVCMYSIKNINQHFINRRKECAQGITASTDISWLPSPKCAEYQFLVNQIDEAGTEYCHRSDQFHPLGGKDPIEAQAIYTDNSILSAIAATAHLEETVIFLGDHHGHLKKLCVVSPSRAELYEEEAILVDQKPVVQNGITFSQDKTFIYFMTVRKIHKIPVANCSQYTTCKSCLGVGNGTGDPYCGWCSLQKSCSTRASCGYSNWLRNRPCISIVNISPNGSQHIKYPLETVTLTFKQLPELSINETYGCRFDELPVSYGITDGQSIQCSAPAKANIPVIPSEEDHVTMLLGVFSSESMVTFISTTFSYFDCTRHTTCAACVSSDWNCDWCVFDNACTHRSSICTHGDTIVTGNNNPVSSPRQGLDFCPQIRPQTTQILLPVGISKDIVVSVASLPDATKVTGYQCSLSVEGTMQFTQATLLTDDEIRCHGRMYTYEAKDKKELVLPLLVHWNDNRQLESNNNTVTLYKCDVDRPDCSRCLSVETARPELGCRWCGTQCTFMENTDCSSSSLSPGSQCPAPVLKHVFPSSGPIEGNTVIEINGSDVGQGFQDIRRVMVGNQFCNLTGLENRYVTGQSVRCRTSPLGSNMLAQTVIVSVARVGGGEDLISIGAVQFTYKDPAITGISPVEGYADGGTILTITGTDLDIGRDIKVKVEANITCDVTSVTSTAIRCRSGVSTEGHAGRVVVTFDGASRSSADIFTFVPLPEINRFDPQSSIQSGGRMLTVYGRGFTVVSSATIKVHYNKETYKQSCRVESDETMLCTTPAITEIAPITNCTHATLGLEVDGKQVLIPNSDFTYCQNPIVQKFDGDEYLVDSANISSLTIKVEMTSWAIAESEITVTVGAEDECQSVTLRDDVLTCRVPYNQPDQDVATVHWYGNGSFILGKVVYKTGVDIFILITTIVVVILLIIPVLVTIKYCRQKRHLKRVTQEYNERLLARIRGLHEEILEATEVRHGPTRQHTGAKANLRAKVKNRLPQKSIVLNEQVNIVPGDLHVKFSQLDMGSILGQGAFGRVFQAVLTDAQIGTGRTVAVKTVQDTDDSTNVIKFLQEGLMMKNFDHPNVLGLIGLTFNPEGQPLVVLPFMPYGDLKSYIDKNKQELTHNQLLKFASHVALGMEYLAKAKFVHRDLAARNCMVGDKLVVKIADFGLSRDLSEEDYYTSSDKHAKLPIKWMAPESMERRVYNTKTDVWSYGVLLWELFSGGRSPYPGIRNRDIYDFLKRGERMDPPRFCHKKISEIMQKCWRDSPKSRCSFREIVGEFDQLLRTGIVLGGAPPLPAGPRGLSDQGERPVGDDKGPVTPLDVTGNNAGNKCERESVGGNEEIGDCEESGNVVDRGSYLTPVGNVSGSHCQEDREECTGVDWKMEVTPQGNLSLNGNRENWDECSESGSGDCSSYLIPMGNVSGSHGQEDREECTGVDRKRGVTLQGNSSLNGNRENWDECNYLIPMRGEDDQGNDGEQCGAEFIPMGSLNGKTGN